MFFNRLIVRRSKESEFVPETTKTQEKGRILIYGNNYDDHVNYIAIWVQGWFKEHSLDERYESHVCKVRGAIESAFFGQMDDSDPKSIPSLVMVGENIRDDVGGGWSDYSIESEMERIRQLCEKNKVPLVRFRFDRASGSPVIKEGSMLRL